jgi:hypothetical protein
MSICDVCVSVYVRMWVREEKWKRVWTRGVCARANFGVYLCVHMCCIQTNVWEQYRDSSATQLYKPSHLAYMHRPLTLHPQPWSHPQSTREAWERGEQWKRGQQEQLQQPLKLLPHAREHLSCDSNGNTYSTLKQNLSFAAGIPLAGIPHHHNSTLVSRNCNSSSNQLCPSTPHSPLVKNSFFSPSRPSSGSGNLSSETGRGSSPLSLSYPSYHRPYLLDTSQFAPLFYPRPSPSNAHARVTGERYSNYTLPGEQYTSSTCGERYHSTTAGFSSCRIAVNKPPHVSLSISSLGSGPGLVNEYTSSHYSSSPYYSSNALKHGEREAARGSELQRENTNYTGGGPSTALYLRRNTY